MPKSELPTTSEERKRMIHIRLRPDTHRRVRIHTADLDLSIQGWVADLIHKALGSIEPVQARKGNREKKRG